MAEEKRFNEKERKSSDGAPMDNPEQIKTDKETMTEMHEEEMNVDSIPLEDLKQDMEDEKNPRDSKDDSASEEKHPE